MLHLTVVNGCGLWKNSVQSESDFDNDTDSDSENDEIISHSKELYEEFSPKSVQHSIYQTITKARKMINYFRKSPKAMEIFRDHCDKDKDMVCKEGADL